MVHLALIAALAQVVITSSAPTMAAPSSSPAEALLIGDSVMNGMAQGYGTAARTQLAARHSFILDTAGCRRLLGTSCSIGGRPRPTNAITELRAMAGQYRRELVVAAGYNDPTFGSEGLDPMLVVADWATLSARLPTAWFSGDGIHLGLVCVQHTHYRIIARSASAARCR